ncbi:hypothetical protein EVA_06618, partial [gut metagenome]
MEGKLFIDGQDAFTEYGIFIEHYGFKDLIAMPGFKKIDSTEWDEYDGEEYDLTNPVLDAHTLTLPFYVMNIFAAGDFFEVLSNKAYHQFEFRDIGRTYRLRLVSNNQLNKKIKIGKMSLTFIDDNSSIPTGMPMATAPAGFKQKEYMLDKIDFSRFGIYILQGTEEDVMKSPQVRENIKYDDPSRNGIIYDQEQVKYKAKQAQLKLLIYANSITEFWARYDAFFCQLLKPGNHILYIPSIYEEYDCFYKKMSITKFDILKTGKVWCEFNVILQFTNMTPSMNVMLL